MVVMIMMMMLVVVVVYFTWFDLASLDLPSYLQ